MIALPQRSLVFGVALKVTVAVAVTAAALFAAIYREVELSTRALAQAAIDADLAGLVDAQTAQGIEGLSARIADRLAFSPGDSNKPFYRLEDTNRRPLAGNLAYWPVADPVTSPSGVFRTPDATPVQYRATVLRGGYRMLAGRAVTESDRWLTRLEWWFGSAFLVIASLAYAIGHLAAAGLNRRIAAINMVFARFGADGQGPRAIVAKPGDEIDSLAEQLNTLLDRTERLLGARRDLSNTIAHEIRTPLVQISALIAKARGAGELAQSEALLCAAEKRVHGLQRMLDALLDIAASEAQRGEMNSLAEVDLAELARSLVELYAPSAESLGLTFEADIAHSVPMRGVPVQLASLLGNLLDNALKYAASGRLIRLTVSPGPVIVIEDDGPGIPSDLAPHIFERFRRGASGTRTSQPGGHGLGLALVRAIAERHGLTVALEASEGGLSGARFVVR